MLRSMPWAVWAAVSLPATHHPSLEGLRHLAPGLISLAPHDYLFPPLTKVVPEMNKVFGQQWKQYSSAGVPWYVVFKVSSYLWSQILASPVHKAVSLLPPPPFFFPERMVSVEFNAGSRSQSQEMAELRRLQLRSWVMCWAAFNVSQKLNRLPFPRVFVF